MSLSASDGTLVMVGTVAEAVAARAERGAEARPLPAEPGSCRRPASGDSWRKPVGMGRPLPGCPPATGGGHAGDRRGDPASELRTGHARLPLRQAGDYPVAIVSLAAALAPDGSIEDIRIAVGSPEASARRWPQLENQLRGRPLDPGTARGCGGGCWLMATSMMINGERLTSTRDPMTPPIDVPRDGFALTGAGAVWRDGNCGACTVHVDGRSVVSCLVPIGTIEGADLCTVESLALAGEPSAQQQIMAAHDVVQFLNPPAAVACAVANATGIRVRQKPLTPPRALGLLLGGEQAVELPHIADNWWDNVLMRQSS